MKCLGCSCDITGNRPPFDKVCYTCQAPGIWLRKHKPMNYHAAYRLEIHATETGNWFSQLWPTDGYHNIPAWESVYYDSMDEAYDAVKYEADERAESAREAAVLARLGPDDRPGESEKD